MRTKLLAVLLVGVLLAGIAGCAPQEEAAEGNGEGYKIGLITDTVSQGKKSLGRGKHGGQIW